MDTAISQASEPVPSFQFHLEAEDRALLSWLQHEPRLRGEPRPFDREACIEVLQKKKDPDWWNADWGKAGIPFSISPEEARFWLAAMTDKGTGAVASRISRVASKAEAPTPSLGDLLKALDRDGGTGGEWVMLPISQLYEAEVFWSAYLEREVKKSAAATSLLEDRWVNMARGFGQFWLPFVSVEQRRALCELVRGHLRKKPWPPVQYQSGYPARPLPWLMAMQLGMADEIAPVVEAWPDDAFQGKGRQFLFNQHPQDMVLRLGTSEEVERHMRRLKLKPHTLEHLRAWIAATELRGLDIARDRILSMGFKKDATEGIALLGRVLAPETAPHMLELSLQSKAPQVARKWLDDYKQIAAYGLTTTADRKGALGDAALDYLRDLCRQRRSDLVLSALTALSAECEGKVRARLGEALEPLTPPVSSTEQAARPSLPAEDVQRTLDLEPDDWAHVSWLPKEVLPRPEQPHFDMKEGLSRLAKIKGPTSWQLDWNALKLSPGMGAEEARFWLAAMLDYRDLTSKERASALSKATIPPFQYLDEALDLLARARDEAPMLPLSILFGALPLVEGLFVWDRGPTANSLRRINTSAGISPGGPANGLRRHCLPYLRETEREALRAATRKELERAVWPEMRGVNQGSERAFYFAAAFGMAEALLPVVESWPDDLFAQITDSRVDYHEPQRLVMSLATPELIVLHMRRLKLKLRTPEQVRIWLATTGFGALDILRDSILAAANKDEAEALIGALSRAHGPEVAPVMLELMLSSRAPRAARNWLDENREHSVVGLIPPAAGRGKLAEAAAEHLGGLFRKGAGALVERTLAHFPEDILARVSAALAGYAAEDHQPYDEASTPAWLRDALAPVITGSVPAWISPEDLPQVTVGGHRLSDAQVSDLMRALASSTPSDVRPLVSAVKQHGDRTALERFAWRLFECWLSEGAPVKERWAMQAVGLLGGDQSALKLAPMIRAWPGESQHARAVLGLEVLRGIGSDTALMQINGIAEKVQFKALKAKAAECMQAIAVDRGLTRTELEDRIVPDCGLNEQGTRTFDFGPRQFRMVIGAGLKPMIKDGNGAIKPDLPKPNAKDDASLASEAQAEWKLLKKQVAEVAKIQAVRLEQAMVTGRRWKAGEFEQLLARHPLMTNLARMIVWGAHDAAGALSATFRVTEDQAYGDSSDKPFDLSSYPQVSIVHPFLLTEGDRAAWGELLSDYDVIPPFTQLGRRLFGLEDGEAEGQEVTRFKGVKINPRSLAFTLEKLGWVRGAPGDGGVVHSHSKPFYSAGVTAVVDYEGGIYSGYIEESGDQEMVRCYVLPEICEPEAYADHANASRLGDVNTIVISEVLLDLTTVAAKGV